MPVFKATVTKKLPHGRYLIEDVINNDSGEPYRYHLWIDCNRNLFIGEEIVFIGTPGMYRKKNGKLRFGIHNIEIQDKL
jgi:hypothetical protein